MTSAHNERRPTPASADLRGSRAAAKPNKTRQKSTTVAPLAPLLQPWAEVLIARATGRVPQYGSAEWEALPDADPHKVAATVIAAEAWRTYWSPEEHERRLRVELEADWPEEEDARWSKETVDQVHRVANRPSFAELSRRRGEPEAEERANAHRRRLGLPVEYVPVEIDPAGHAPTHHTDGRRVRYWPPDRPPLRAVPNG